MTSTTNLTLTTRDAAEVEAALDAPAKPVTALSRLLALVDADAPTKVTRPWKNEPAVQRAKRALSTREPDIFDEVTGEALWFGEGFAVVVGLDRLDDFRAWIATRCMAPCGRGSFGVDALVTADVGWERVLQTVTA
jgi:hypothetical protein